MKSNCEDKIIANVETGIIIIITTSDLKGITEIVHSWYDILHTIQH